MKVVREFKDFLYFRFSDRHLYLVGSMIRNPVLDWFFYKFFRFSIKSSLEINRLFEFSNKFNKFNKFRFSDTSYSFMVSDSLDKNFLGYLIPFYLLDFGKCFLFGKFKPNFFFGDYEKVDELNIDIYSDVNQFIPYFVVYSTNFLITPNDFSSVARCFTYNYLNKSIFLFNLLFFFRRLYSRFFKFFGVLSLRRGL